MKSRKDINKNETIIGNETVAYTKRKYKNNDTKFLESVENEDYKNIENSKPVGIVRDCDMKKAEAKELIVNKFSPKPNNPLNASSGTSK